MLPLSETADRPRFNRLPMLWLAVFWSISLTDRVNLLKSEMEKAHRALQSSEHQLSEILEAAE